MAIKYTCAVAILLSSFSGLAENKGDLGWQKVSYLAKNYLNVKRQNAEVCIKLPNEFSDPQAVFVMVNNGEKRTSVEAQPADCNGDQAVNEVQLLLDFAPQQTKTIELLHKAGITPNSGPDRTLAELAVRVGGQPGKDNKLVGGDYLSVKQFTLPKEHFVGDKLFKYEGVGLESDKVAYRYYFDHRGSLDVFGKSKPELVLPMVGIDGSDYHKLAGWGMDVLKVGSSFGLGTPAQWHAEQVHKMSKFDDLSVELSNGSNSANFTLHFANWQTPSVVTDAQVKYQINYGDQKVRVSALTSKRLNAWATGLVNHDLPRLEYVAAESEWGYIATYGKQSLAGDNLGLAVFFKTSELKSLHTDNVNHTVLFKPSTNSINYYFLADWQGGFDGSQNQVAFINNLKRHVAQLNSPISITKL